jgi:hypothetical protein
MFGRYCWLGVGGLVLCSVIAQIRIDHRHWQEYDEEDDSYDWTYEPCPQATHFMIIQYPSE